MKLLAPLVLAALAASSLAQEGAGFVQGDLRVLFVGHDPAAPDVMFASMAKPRTWALHRERTAAFEALLRYHFEDVQVVHAADYEVAMSAAADVTIFDTPPKALVEAVRDGEDYRPAEYLPRDFAHAAITIAGTSDRVGEPLGLKLDWL